MAITFLKRNAMIVGAIFGTLLVVITLAVGLNVIVYSLMSENLIEEVDASEEISLSASAFNRVN